MARRRGANVGFHRRAARPALAERPAIGEQLAGGAMLVLVGRGLSLRAPAFGSCRGDAAGRSTGPTRIAVDPPGGAGLRRIVIVSLALIAVVAAGVAAFTVSPWPSVL
jgi:hypothetical protein